MIVSLRQAAIAALMLNPATADAKSQDRPPKRVTTSMETPDIPFVLTASTRNGTAGDRGAITFNLEKRDTGTDIARFRLRTAHRPATIGRPQIDVEVLRQRLSFMSAPSNRDNGVGAGARARHIRVSATMEHEIAPGIEALFAWRAARLGSHDGNITADGGKNHRRKASDYFLPHIALKADLGDGLSLRMLHDEQMRANLDPAIFGPRSLTADEWLLSGNRLDFERSTSNEAAIAWNVADNITFSTQLRHSGYRNRLLPDQRGLLRTLAGRTDATAYGSALAWRVDAGTLLRIDASHETMSLNGAEGGSTGRSGWSIAFDREDGGRRFHIRVGQQDILHFREEGGIASRPAWIAEAAAEQPLTLANHWPDMTMRLEARSAPRLGEGDNWNLASRDMAPQIRLGLSARW